VKNAPAYFVRRAVDEEKHFTKMTPEVHSIKPFTVANNYVFEYARVFVIVSYFHPSLIIFVGKVESLPLKWSPIMSSTKEGSDKYSSLLRFDINYWKKVL
jgi:hypothetical protein